jgi:hypothetical protein
MHKLENFASELYWAKLEMGEICFISYMGLSVPISYFDSMHFWRSIRWKSLSLWWAGHAHNRICVCWATILKIDRPTLRNGGKNNLFWFTIIKKILRIPPCFVHVWLQRLQTVLRNSFYKKSIWISKNTEFVADF